ncbi:hypothetical protein ACIBTW_00870 [Micromonospora parva]|uniref:hypothetical protein n=1 Tax=Micromonospora parva TaxID=1464048 RepID=UPI0037A60B87
MHFRTAQEESASARNHRKTYLGATSSAEGSTISGPVSPEPDEAPIEQLASLSQDLEQLAQVAIDDCADASQRGTETDAITLVNLALALHACSAEMVECAVAHARSSGVKWRQIGALLGVSRQAAHAQFSDAVQHRRNGGWSDH